MMQKIARSIIQVWLLSVAILISGAQYNVAQAQDNPKQHRMAVACGKELRKQCGGGAVAGLSGRTGASGYASGNGLLSAIGLGRLAGLAAADEVKSRNAA